MKMTFCVPVHNRAGLIGDCLESLMDQTMAPDDYEIILVDDGSTDGSAEAAEALFASHGFTNGQVHRLPVNSGGASVPRNEAVARARGDYLFFVDSDDYVAPDLAERVHACARANQADLVYVRYADPGQGPSQSAGSAKSRVDLPGEAGGDLDNSWLRPPQAFSSRGDLPQADIVDDLKR